MANQNLPKKPTVYFVSLYEILNYMKQAKADEQEGTQSIPATKQQNLQAPPAGKPIVMAGDKNAETLLQLLERNQDNPALGWGTKFAGKGFSWATDSEIKKAISILRYIACPVQFPAHEKTWEVVLFAAHGTLENYQKIMRSKELQHYGFLSDRAIRFLTKEGEVRTALAMSENLYAKLSESAATQAEQCQQLNARCEDLQTEIDRLRTTQSKSAEFDKGSPTYPPELAIALEAWRAVSTTEGKGKPKARIHTWLDAHYPPPKLFNKAKERIAVVCNWEKQGGASLSE